MNSFLRVLDMVFNDLDDKQNELDNKQSSYDYMFSEYMRLSNENRQLKDELEAMKKAAPPCDPELISSINQEDYSTKEVSTQ